MPAPEPVPEPIPEPEPVAAFEPAPEIEDVFELTADSRYAGTTLLNAWIYGHTVVAILTSIIWVALIILSLKRFPVPAAPSAFSRAHRFWGRTGMITMMLAGLSAFPLYYYGFMQ